MWDALEASFYELREFLETVPKLLRVGAIANLIPGGAPKVIEPVTYAIFCAAWFIVTAVYLTSRGARAYYGTAL